MEGDLRLSPAQRVAIGALGAAVAIHNIGAVVACIHATGCIHRYWAQFWLLSYGDGFERRALLGSLLRWATGDAIPASLIAFLALGIAVLALALFVVWGARAAGARWPLLAGALVLGPSMTLLAETLGDPMQAALVLTGLAALVPGRVGAVVCLLAIPPVILIHEAAIFLHVPVLLALAAARSGRRPAILPLAAITVALAAASLLFADQPGSAPSARIVTATGAEITLGGAILPDFMELLRQEMQARFDSPAAAVRTAEMLVRALAWPLLMVAALAALRGDAAPLRAFAALLALSLPLYAVAVDWGRFAMHALFGAFVLARAGASPRFGPVEAPVAAGLGRAVRALRRVATREVLVVALFLYIANPHYRIDGMTRENVVAMVAVLGLLLVLQEAARRTTGAKDGAAPP